MYSVKHKALQLGALIFVILIMSGTMLVTRWADADRAVLGTTERMRRAVMQIRNARILRTEGITIAVRGRDGVVTPILLPMVSNTLNPEESFEFYRVPTTPEIIAREVYQQEVRDGPTIDTRAINRFLLQVLSGTLHDPTNAHFVVDGSKILIADDAPGQAVDSDLIIKKIEYIVRNLSPQTIEANAYDVRARVTSDRLTTREALARAVSRSVTFHVWSGDYAWDISGKDLVPMLTLDEHSSGLVLDEDKLYLYMKTLANSLIVEPVVEPVFGVQRGRIVTKQAGVSGHDIDVHSLAIYIDSQLKSLFDDMATSSNIAKRRYSVELAYRSTPPHFSTDVLQKMGITMLVGTATTSFRGSSADRIHNISLGATRVSGFIVEPGEEFSLVRAIGYAEKENGYKEEYVIKGDRSRKEAGGCLCQVATTFFRTALSSGVHITERHNHRYVVGYYGPGLDAGIYGIDHDFRFINDFSSPLLIQARIKGNELVVEFFARGDGRVSITSKPQITDVLPPPLPVYRFSNTIPFGKTECTDHPREGMTSYATTSIRYASGDLSVRTWESTYEPWPMICLIGTGGLTVYQEDN